MKQIYFLIIIIVIVFIFIYNKNLYPPKDTDIYSQIYKNLLSLETRFKNKPFNIYFLKTHKTAGSAVNNVLLRIALKRNITYIDQLRKFSDSRYKIFTKHTIHNPNLSNSVFSKKNSIYITILRNPVSQFLSGLNYYPDEISNFPNFFKNYQKNMLKSYPKKSKYNCWTRNLMSYDLGIVTCGGKFEVSKRQLLEKVYKDFDIVLLTEYFNEGMILLKKTFGLQYEDVVSFKINEGFRSPTEKQRNLVEKIIRKESKADMILYEFYKNFYEKIRPKLESEVKILERLNKEYINKCIEKREKQYFFDKIPIKGFVLKNNTDKGLNEKCHLLTMTDENIRKFIKNHQKTKN